MRVAYLEERRWVLASGANGHEAVKTQGGAFLHNVLGQCGSLRGRNATFLVFARGVNLHHYGQRALCGMSGV